jgi:hypothetical protein
MTFHPAARPLVVAVALGASIVLAWAARSEARPDQFRLPFRCNTREWEKTFDVGEAKYDPSTGKLTWVLEAKQPTRLERFEAFVGDPDGVEAAVVDVTFTPNRAELQAKAKVTATVLLTHVDAETVSTVTIRPKP